MAKPTDQMQEVLDAHEAMGPLPIESLTPELARQIPLPDRAAAAVYGQHFIKRALAPMPLPIGKVQHVTIPGGDSDIMARIYTPNGGAPSGGWPVLVYFHGGGFVIATLDTYDSSCRALCAAASCLVVSIHYRQAPEHKWPAAPRDAYAGYNWVLEHIMRYQGNKQKVAIGGESAGGNLAAIVSMMARDKGIAMPVHQLLIYPVTDMAHGVESPSAKEHKDAKPLNTAMLRWFYNFYLPGDADTSDPYISPLLATHFQGLPTATVIVAQIDPLRSDGEHYAQKLRTAGIEVAFKQFDGVTHEFFGMAGLVSEASDAVAFAAHNLKKAFSETKRAVAA